MTERFAQSKKSLLYPSGVVKGGAKVMILRGNLASTELIVFVIINQSSKHNWTKNNLAACHSDQVPVLAALNPFFVGLVYLTQFSY